MKKKTQKSNLKEYIVIYLAIFFLLIITLAIRGKLSLPIKLTEFLFLTGAALFITLIAIIGGKGNRKVEKKYGVKIRGRYQLVHKDGELVKNPKLINKVLFSNPLGAWILLIPFLLLLSLLLMYLV